LFEVSLLGCCVALATLDFLHYVAGDPDTAVIAFYIESIRRPVAFFEKAREVRRAKPIVVLKPGRSREGAKASAFHTGSHATDHVQIEDALRRHGIPRAQDEDEFLNALRALVMLPRPRGRRVGAATTSGALGVIATDLLVENGLELASFEPATLAQMRSILPDWLEPANPFDFWIGIDVKGAREAHAVGLAAVFADPNVDLVLCTLLAPGNADFAEFGGVIAAPARQPCEAGRGRDLWRRGAATLDRGPRGREHPRLPDHARCGARPRPDGRGHAVGAVAQLSQLA
jgi:acetate---CoA ligase (ADP-forming)